MKALRRREFIGLASGAMAARAFPVYAQPPAMPVIGWLGARSPAESASVVAAFHQGLNDTGYVDGKNVAIEYRWAELQYDRLPTLAAELVARRGAVIAATGGGASPLAAKAATTTIPIVFVAGDLDPVVSGLVASLNRPGGNITGVLLLLTVLGPKRLELLRELVPKDASSVSSSTRAIQAQPPKYERCSRRRRRSACSWRFYEPAPTTISRRRLPRCSNVAPRRSCSVMIRLRSNVRAGRLYRDQALWAGWRQTPTTSHKVAKNQRSRGLGGRNPWNAHSNRMRGFCIAFTAQG